MAKDKEYIKIIQSRQWRQVRQAKWRSAKGLCEDCLQKGIIRPATEVHHIIPIESGRNYEEKCRLAYDPENLRCLCSDCHHKAHIKLGSHSYGYVRILLNRRSDDWISKMFGDNPAK